MPCERERRRRLTLWQKVSQSFLKLGWRDVADGREALVVRDQHAGEHVGRIVSQVDLQALVAKNGLLVAKNWICEGGVESADGLGGGIGRLDKRDVDGIVRRGRPLTCQAGARQQEASYSQSSAELAILAE